MTFAQSIQQASFVIGGTVILNAVAQAVWNNHTVRKIALLASFGGALAGMAVTTVGVVGLIFPFTYDSPYTWNAPEGLAYQFSQTAKTGALLTTISAVAFIII
jgi:hypothetical protein